MKLNSWILELASAAIRSGAATGGIALYERYGPKNSLNYPSLFLSLLIATVLIDGGRRRLRRRKNRETTP